MINATPAKLRSGDWGAKVQGSVSCGDTIHITTRSGKEWDATVSHVVWAGDGVAIVATQSHDRQRTGGRGHARGTWTGCACGSVEEYERDGDCASCKHDRY